MTYEDVAQRISDSHELIQERPIDRLDYINKIGGIRQVIMSCIVYLDQLYSNNKGNYNEEDLTIIHESVCVSAIPLLDMVEYFMDKAEKEADDRHFAV